MNSYEKAVCLGIVAGMRSMMAPAIVSDQLSNDRQPGLDGSTLGYLASPKVAAALKVMSAGEAIADKLPWIPSRIAPGPLVGRIISGAICGAAVCAADGKKRELGAVAGGLAAIASAFAFYHLRRTIGKRSGLPDPVLALGEDATALGIGLQALRD